MKILKLRLQNLNSVYGSWEIDFTHPDYEEAGIFAIVGPTGSGKSTILDAISLALFGKTPRLGLISSSNNEIMSRHTAECLAEVEFETAKGVYSCTWSQAKAHKKVDGKLQDSSHEISDLVNKKILATKKRDVLDCVKEITGLDYEQFTRSILLPQGGFADFLQANSAERAPILEQITGTGIYTEISKKVHEVYTLKKSELERLQSILDNIQLLTDEEIKNYKETIKVSQNELAAVKKKRETNAEYIQWQQTVQNLKEELNTLHEDIENNKQAIEDFLPDRERLQQALKAAQVQKEVNDYLQGIERLKQSKKDLHQAEIKTKESHDTLNEKKHHEKVIENEFTQAKAAVERFEPIYKEVLLLDKDISIKNTELERLTAQMTALKETLKRDKADLSQCELNEKEYTKSLGDIESSFQQSAGDEFLVSSLSGIEQQLNQQNQLQQQRNKLIQRLEHEKSEQGVIAKKLTDNKRLQDQYNLDENKSLESLQQEKLKLSQLLSGQDEQSIKELLEITQKAKSFADRAADLEQQRNSLVAGEPCALCGSTEHPFVDSKKPPEPDELTQRIQQLNDKLAQIDEFKESVSKYEKDLELCERNKSENNIHAQNLKNEQLKLEKSISELIGEVEDLDNTIQSGITHVDDLLKPIGLSAQRFADVTALINDLNKRKNNWLELNKQKELINTQLFELKGQQDNLKTKIQSVQNQYQELTEHQQNVKKDFDNYVSQRKDIFTEGDIQVERQRLHDARSHAEHALETYRIELNDLKSENIRYSEALTHSQKSLEERQADLLKRTDIMNSALQENGFKDIESYQAVSMPTEKIARLKEIKIKLDNDFTVLQTKQKDRQERLTKEQSKELTKSPIEELLQQKAALIKSEDELTSSIAQAEGRLNYNEESKQQQQEQLDQIEVAENEKSHWGHMHTLIGSNDGKKFRNFAQGLTFEIMINHANKELKKISKRYLLIHDAKTPLQLDVVDADQGGEIRSTKNLSGGESFLVSLALALGLSKMASSNISIDSLFLDEGFGTLDEDALDMVVGALTSINQEGKIIGVISHVPSLKERITTQINLLPTSGGKSIIKGKGCRLMN